MEGKVGRGKKGTEERLNVILLQQKVAKSRRKQINHLTFTIPNRTHLYHLFLFTSALRLLKKGKKETRFRKIRQQFSRLYSWQQKN